MKGAGRGRNAPALPYARDAVHTHNESEIDVDNRLRIRISKAITDDLAVRSPDDDGCWGGIDAPGAYRITRERARLILGDCEFQGNIGGDYIDSVGSGVTRAYRALHRQICKVLKESAT